MRIVAGDFRGLRLLAPEAGAGTHPMGDRVKLALFNMVGNLVSGGRVLDLFAGTGAIGLEALSRGALEVVLVEKNAKMTDLIQKNVQNMDQMQKKSGFKDSNVTKKVKIERADAFRWVKEAILEPEGGEVGGGAVLMQEGLKGRFFDLIVIDPPYELFEKADFEVKLRDLMEKLGKILTKNGAVVLSAPKDYVLEVKSLQILKIRHYAGANLIILGLGTASAH